MKNKLVGKEVVVSNIPVETDEEELRKLFSVSGSVRSIKMLRDANDNFYGKAFIRMASTAEAQDAINSLDGARLSGRNIQVSPPRQKPAQDIPDSDLPGRSKRPKLTRRKRK